MANNTPADFSVEVYSLFTMTGLDQHGDECQAQMKHNNLDPLSVNADALITQMNDFRDTVIGMTRCNWITCSYTLGFSSGTTFTPSDDTNSNNANVLTLTCRRAAGEAGSPRARTTITIPDVNGAVIAAGAPAGIVPLDDPSIAPLVALVNANGTNNNGSRITVQRATMN